MFFSFSHTQEINKQYWFSFKKAGVFCTVVYWGDIKINFVPGGMC